MAESFGEYLIVTYQEGLSCLDTLQHATEYLAKQYSDRMPRDKAQAHFDARALLLNRRMGLLNEMELEYMYGTSDAETGEGKP